VFDLIDLFVSKGVPLFLIIKLFIFLIPNILTLAVPVSVLFGVLIAYGKLSVDNEITAMKSSGVDYKTLTMPIIIFVCVISFFLLFFNHFLSPSMNSNFRNLYKTITTRSPLVKFNQKTVVRLGQYRLYANKVCNKDNKLSGVSIYKFADENAHEDIHENAADKQIILPQNDSGSWRIAASSATIKVYQTGIKLTLHNGYWQKAHPSNMNNMIHATFKSYCFFIPLGDVIKEYSVTPKEMSSAKLLKVIKDHKEQNIDYVNYDEEFWFRWIFALAPISFVFVALPIGIITGKGGKTIGFAMSLSIVLIYYILLMVSITLSEKKYAPISLMFWIPNAVVAIAGLYLFTKMVKK
jgi:lipopolysaccharide export LptBFGC system permease protein LptF